MIHREAIVEVLERYNPSGIRVATIGSHSALDVCDGAVEEGFRTLVVCERGREAPYTRYFRASRDKDGRAVRGTVDETLVLGTEEREEERSYYWLLEKAKLPAPERIADARDIQGLSIVKLPHKVKKLERGFFTAATFKEYREKSEALLKQDVITKEDLGAARIEKYIIGPIFNFDFFYSPIEEEAEKIELLGVDWRFETSLDGHVRLPADQQLALTPTERIPEYVVVGHNSATLRESSLKDVFDMAERYVAATQRHFPPGIIGPFTLQTAVDKDLKFWIYDVSPRIGGGTNVHMSVGHPYGNSLWHRSMSTGRRIAMEIRQGVDTGRLGELVT